MAGVASTSQGRIQRLRALRRNALPLLGLALLSALLFRRHLTGAETFIGDADRLDTFLNMQKFQVESLQQLGRVPTWNPYMFAGFDADGLHWMLPGADPIAYLEALFPISELYRIAGFVSAGWLVVAAWTAYAFIHDSTKSRFAAFVGAGLYVFSAMAILRIAQVDQAFAVHALIPLGMLALRRVTRRGSVGCFIGVSLVLTALALLTFLQEVAYVSILFGTYALYRAAILRSWRPLLVVIPAQIGAAVVALPRLITVGRDLQSSSRASAMVFTCPCEVLRYFDDGIFGRYLAEAGNWGNSLNTHEGLQVYMGALTSLVVLVGAMRYRGALHAAAGAAVVCLIAYVVALVLAPAISGLILVVIGAVLAVAVWLRSRRSRLTPPRVADVVRSDAPFHLAFLALTLAIILVPLLQQLFFLAFLRVNFSHARMTVAALLPLATLAAQFVDELLERAPALRSRQESALVLALGALAAGIVTWAVAALTALGERIWIGPGNSPLLTFGQRVLPGEVVLVAASAVVMAALLGASELLSGRGMRGRDIPRPIWRADGGAPPPLAALPGFCLGFAMLFQAFANGDFQINGPQTQTFPVAYEDNNLFAVPSFALNPPDPAALLAAHQQLESDNYRTVLTMDPSVFPVALEPGYVEAHLSQFWQLRLVGGYSIGVPLRLSQLPWLTGTNQGLRDLSFGPIDQLPWGLLALLNVKDAVVVDGPLYYNLPRSGPDSELRVVPNPAPVTPRAFFARSVLGTPDSADAPAAPSLVTTAEESIGTVRVSWSAPWDPSAQYQVEWTAGGLAFAVYGPYGPAARSLPIGGLQPDVPYSFRVRACRPTGCSSASNAVGVTLSRVALTPPANVRVAPAPEGGFQLSWDGESASAVEIDRRLSTGSDEGPVGRAPAGATGYTDAQADASQGYVYRARACDDTGCGPDSTEVYAGPGALRAAFELRGMLPDNVRDASVAEGYSGVTTFSAEGAIQARYAGDQIDLDVDPSSSDRFLVVNELYDPGWHAYVDGQEEPIYPTNLAMRGLLVPAGAQHVQLRFTPFLLTRTGLLISLAGLLFLVGTWPFLRYLDRR